MKRCPFFFTSTVTSYFHLPRECHTQQETISKIRRQGNDEAVSVLTAKCHHHSAPFVSLLGTFTQKWTALKRWTFSAAETGSTNWYVTRQLANYLNFIQLTHSEHTEQREVHSFIIHTGIMKPLVRLNLMFLISNSVIYIVYIFRLLSRFLLPLLLRHRNTEADCRQVDRSGRFRFRILLRCSSTIRAGVLRLLGNRLTTNRPLKHRPSSKGQVSQS